MRRTLSWPDIPKETLYVHRLHIYPHAMREANAYYSPEKKALLFGTSPPRSRIPAATCRGSGLHMPGRGLTGASPRDAAGGIDPRVRTNPDGHREVRLST